MAFKILDEEKLSLLNDSQRRQYENELDIYKQRLAFVEQLEAYSEVEIPPFEPKLKAIDVIGEIKLRPFSKPEYALIPCEPVEKPEPGLSSFAVPVQEKPVLPEFSKLTGVGLGHIKSIESTKAELPPVKTVTSPVKPRGKIRVKKAVLPIAPAAGHAIKGYKPPDNKHLNLPKQPSLPMPEAYTLKPIVIDKSITDVALSKISLPGLEQLSFAPLEMKKTTLPRISIRQVAIRRQSAAVQQKVNLPTQVKPGHKVEAINKLKTVQKNLPELPSAVRVEAQFKKPEFTAFSMPGFKSADFNNIKPAVPVLPKIAKENVKAKAFKAIGMNQVNIVPVKAASVSFRPVGKIESKANALPRVSVNGIDNPYEKFSELLLLSDENIKSMEGNG